MNPMKKPSIHLPSPLQALAWGYLSAAIVWVVYSLYRIYQASWTTLTLDQWRFYTDYFAKPFPENILTLQNGHPTAVPGLVRLADVHLAGANNHLILVVGILLTISAACLISWIIWRSQELDNPIKMICISLTWMAIFWLANTRVLAHDPVLSYSIATLSFTVAIWYLIRANEVYRQEGRTEGLNKTLLAAAFACLIATFSFGSGILTWVVILIIMVVLRLPLKNIGFWGALFVVSLVLRTLLPGRGLNAAGLSFNPVNVLEAASAWLGAPVIYILRNVGLEDIPGRLVICTMLGGLALLALTLIFLKKLIKPHRISSLEICGLALSAFGAGMALLIAIGRGAQWVGQLHQYTAPRYLPWACLFWIGFLILLGVYAQRQAQRTVRRDVPHKIATPDRAVALRSRPTPHRVSRHNRQQRVLSSLWLGVVCLLPILMLPAHIVNSTSYRIAKTNMKETALGLVVGVHDDQRVRVRLFKRPDIVYQLAEELQSRGLAMFSWEVSGAMGKPIDETFDVVAGSGVRGRVLKITPFADRDRVGARIEGWAIDETDRPPRYVVVANAEGRIEGLALFTRSRRGFAERMKIDPGIRTFFAGYIKEYAEEEAYTFYAILSDGRSAVPLPAR